MCGGREERLPIARCRAVGDLKGYDGGGRAVPEGAQRDRRVVDVKLVCACACARVCVCVCASPGVWGGGSRCAGECSSLTVRYCTHTDSSEVLP